MGRETVSDINLSSITISARYDTRQVDLLAHNLINKVTQIFFTSIISRRRLLQGAFSLAAAISLVNCASNSSPIPGERKTNALRADAPGRRELITISSLRIAPLTTVPGLQIDGADMKRFYKSLAEAFASESGIDTTSDVEAPTTKHASSPDATLHTEITRYGKDSASALGASKAALFAVNYSIVRHRDQKEIWTSNFYSTEQPDTYNLIEVAKRINRDKGTKLPTIEELEVEAAHSAAVEFATRRVDQYTIK